MGLEGVRLDEVVGVGGGGGVLDCGGVDVVGFVFDVDGRGLVKCLMLLVRRWMRFDFRVVGVLFMNGGCIMVRERYVMYVGVEKN